MVNLKLGKTPARENAIKFSLSNYIPLSALPTAPAVWSHASLVSDWGMLGNDKYGCCVTEGTLVSAGAINVAYRIPYRGPILTLKFASGNELSVTPNHAVLTPTGFTLARLLQKGDNTISAFGPEVMKSLFGGSDSDHAPAPVEEKFSSLKRRASRTGTRHLVMPSVDLHGDQEFIDGDVEVISPDGFLQGELHTSLGQPYRHEQIGPAGEHEAVLHGDGAALQGSLVGGSASFGLIGSTGHATALLDGQCGVPHGEGSSLGADFDPRFFEHSSELSFVDPSLLGQDDISLAGNVSVKEGLKVERGEFISPSSLKGSAGRAGLVASVEQPSGDGTRTDAELGGDLLKRFPGSVSTDRLVDIELSFYEGHVYDLSNDVHWYVANGILTHNCVWAGASHETMLWKKEANGSVTFTSADALSDYSAVTGFKPSDPNSDQGTDMEEAAAYRRKTGIIDSAKARHQIAAYVALPGVSAKGANGPGVITTLANAAYAFGAVGIGIEFPSSAMYQFNSGEPWDVVAGSPIEGGHYVPVVGRLANGNFQVITWGAVQEVTSAFLVKYMDEAIVYLSFEFLAGGKSIEGFDLKALNDDLAALGGTPVVDPTPVPTPGTIDAMLWAAVRTWALGKHYTTATKAVAAALVKWAHASGLT